MIVDKPLSQEERLPVASDNLQQRIDSVMKLVGRYLGSNLVQYNGREEELKLSVTLDKLKTLCWSENEKKALYAALKLGLTYSNELRHIYGNEAQIFSDAFGSLAKKGLIEVVEEGPLYNLKMNYLAHNSKYMSNYARERIILCGLTPPAKDFLMNKNIEALLEQEIDEFHLHKVCQEAAKFNIVARQVEAAWNKRAEEEQEKKNQLELQNKLSRRADELIVEHENQFPALIEEFNKLIQENPTQRGFLITKKRKIADIYNGKNERIDWKLFVKQRKRVLENPY